MTIENISLCENWSTPIRRMKRRNLSFGCRKYKNVFISHLAFWLFDMCALGVLKMDFVLSLGPNTNSIQVYRTSVTFSRDPGSLSGSGLKSTPFRNNGTMYSFVGFSDSPNFELPHNGCDFINNQYLERISGLDPKSGDFLRNMSNTLRILCAQIGSSYTDYKLIVNHVGEKVLNQNTNNVSQGVDEFSDVTDRGNVHAETLLSHPQTLKHMERPRPFVNICMGCESDNYSKNERDRNRTNETNVDIKILTTTKLYNINYSISIVINRAVKPLDFEFAEQKTRMSNRKCSGQRRGNVPRLSQHHCRYPWQDQKCTPREEIQTSTRESDLNNTLHPVSVSLNSVDGKQLSKQKKSARNHIFWDKRLETECQNIMIDRSESNWLNKLNNFKILHVELGCGRMENRLLILSDGTKVCSRYRFNWEQIAGEIYSSALAKLLKIQNIPFTTLKEVNFESAFFKNSKEALMQARWVNGKSVVLTEWVEDMTSARAPEEFRDFSQNFTLSDDSLYSKSTDDLCFLKQWSDMVLFDYLTGNSDRFINNMYNMRWNENMLNSPVHNLGRQERTKSLIFYDNEFAFFHGYKMLEVFNSYHEKILRSICMFRKSTVEMIEQIYMSTEKIRHGLEKSLSGFPTVSSVPTRILNVLQNRMFSVHKHFQWCQTRDRALRQ